MISVVVPIYNVEKYIVKCLESIVNQNYKDFELLLVNDGSKDNSIKLAKEYLKDKNLDYRIINKENGGLASARNAGIKKAKGEYIAFLDSDDCYARDFLSSLVKKFKKDVDFVFCGYQFVKNQESPIDDNKVIKEFNREELLGTFLKRTIPFVVPSMMFRKDFIVNNNLYFDENIRFSEDQPFIWNVILKSNKTMYLYKKMYGYYIRENSIMTSSSYDKIMSSFNEYKEYILDLFINYPEYISISSKILPRWELGTLYTCAKLVDYQNYKKIYDAMDGRSILKRIKGIGERNAYLLGAVCSMSPKFLYTLCRKMNLNG